MLTVEGSTGPIVVDIGTSTVRAGYAGADRPSVVEKCYVGHREHERIFPLVCDKPQSNIHVNSLWKSMDAAGNLEVSEDVILTHALSSVVSRARSGAEDIDKVLDAPLDNAVLISEPSLQNNAYRQKVVQLLFEKLGCRGAFVSKRSVLSAFSVGKITGLVVSVGAGVTNVSCIVGGHSNAHLSSNSSVAGDAIDHEIASRLRQHNPHVNFLPKAFSEHPHVHASFLDAAQRHYVRLMKEDICRVAENKDLRVSVGNAAYMLPDGTLVDCSKVSQSAPEVLFSEKDRSISGLVSEVIDKCRTSDENLASSILGSVVVCGGTSVMTGFTERIQNDLSGIFAGKEVKCMSGASASDKQHSAWIGGSIVASLGNFSSLWITKREYEEHGIGIVGKKCP